MKKNYLLIYLIFTSILFSLNGYSADKKIQLKIYDSLTGISGKILLHVMEKHVIQRQSDSVVYYYKMIDKKIIDNELLGIAQLHLSKNKLLEKKYFQAITCLHKALEHFKKIKATEKEIETYLKLATLYKKIRSTDLSHEIDSILIHQYDKKLISNILKSKIQMNHASYIASIGKNQEAIQVLKDISYNDFRNHPSILKYYYEELHKRYTKIGALDSAKVYLKKTYIIPIVLSPEDEIKKNIYYAAFFNIKKKPLIALNYINKAKNNEAFKYLEQFDLIKLYKVEYLAQKSLGKFEPAFHALKKYNNVRDSLKNFNLNLNASILNFKLNRNKKIKDLEAKSEINSLVMEEKKRFYIFSTLLISVSVSILIFLIVQHKRRKKSLKLQYENEKMKEIAEMKNSFIENLSHEIRTPITITTGYLQMITNNVMDYSKIVKYADLTIRNNEQIIGMLNNFLTLLKLDKNTMESKKTTVKMEAFFKESVYAFQGISEIKGVYVYYKSNIKPNQKIEYAYEDLRKIINNIVSNAIKYTKPKYGIYVHTFIDKNGLNITIKDEGIGIDKKEQKLIFNRFYQTKNNLTNGGFGIGLSLVHELVTKLNGIIQLDSKKNVGSVFTIQLPLVVENPLLYIDENEQVFQSISKPELSTIVKPNNLPKILIVDDNIEMIGYLKDLLSALFDCTFAFDGAQAVAFAKKTKYDLILSDLRMPLLDGHELKSTLNTLENYKNIPFMIITASAEEYLKNKKEEFGVNDYLIKPFEGIELLTRIYYHLEQNIYKKQVQNTEISSVHYNGVYSEFMNKVNNIILENINNNNFSISEMAKECGYSHKQFIQIIQEKTGLTPVKMILEIRLQKAYNLIVNDKYDNISEVLYAVGINSRSYFNKVFVKRFGLKPGELIKKCKVQKKAS